MKTRLQEEIFSYDNAMRRNNKIVITMLISLLIIGTAIIVLSNNYGERHYQEIKSMQE